MDRLWLARPGDEVRLTEGRFVGYYATVIECNGIEALVEFPDKARTIHPAEALDLVLRPAPSADAGDELAARIRAEELGGVPSRPWHPSAES